MTLPAAGWFPDPQDPARLRWWDGTTWGAATRVLPTRPEAVVPVVVTPVGPAFSVQTGPVRSGSWASGLPATHRFSIVTALAVLFAVASVVVNPWGVPSAIAVAAAVIGTVRPGVTGAWKVAARSLAASALVLGVATAAVAASAQYHLY